jgi:hypothetical protein
MIHRLQVCDTHFYGECKGDRPTCKLRWICRCKANDAWRCAVAANRSDVVACECPCHKAEEIAW